jgi:thioredoxin 1
MATPTKVSESEFSTKVLQAEGTVLVDFYADWCGPCKMIAPIREELANEYDGRLSVMKVDVDNAQMVAGNYGVQSIPTLMFFRDGQPVHKVVGAKPKALLKADVEKALAVQVA